MNDAQNVGEMSSSCAELFDFSFCRLNTACQKYIQIRLSILGPKHSWDTYSPIHWNVKCNVCTQNFSKSFYMTVLLLTRWLFSICNKWSRNSREICTVNKIACYLLHGIVLYIFFLLYFFLLACIFGKVSKGGVGSNKEENMTQSGTVQYVQGLGKNRPLSSNYLCTKQNWKSLCVLALVYWWSSDCKLYDIKIAQIIEVQLCLQY